MEVRKAVILAAGLGKRFYPLTRAQPKEMLPVLDKPVIHYVVEEALKSGLDTILVVVGKGKDAIINYLDKNFLDETMASQEFKEWPEIFFVRQREPLGSGDALKCAKRFVGEDPFVLLLGDTIYKSHTDETVTAQILKTFYKVHAPTIALEKVEKNKIKDYGIIDGKEEANGTWKISHLVEKPEPDRAPSNLGVTGIYVLDKSIFECLDAIKPGRNDEYQITDALELMAKRHALYGTEFSGERYDIGTKELWVKWFIKFAGEDKRFSRFLGK